MYFLIVILCYLVLERSLDLLCRLAHVRESRLKCEALLVLISTTHIHKQDKIKKVNKSVQGKNAQRSYFIDHFQREMTLPRPVKVIVLEHPAPSVLN